MKRTAKKMDLLPDILAHAREKKKHNVRISIIDYDERHFQEKEAKTVEECFPFRKKKTVTWINIDGVHQTDIIEKLGKKFGFHPLLMEDIVNTQQRPKLDVFDDYLFIVLKMLYHEEKTHKIREEQVSLILGEDFLITIQEEVEGDVFNDIRQRLRKAKGRARKLGADYLAYTIIDAIVDNYFDLLEELGEKIGALEDKVFTNSTQGVIQTMYRLKGKMISLRKSIWPLREVVNALSRAESDLIKDSTVLYLRDVYEHTIQIIDHIETSRDILANMLEVHLSSTSNKLNEVIKFLTVVGTIFIPLTFITGIYGMNFRFFPELGWKYGYFMVLGIMLAIALGMVYYFKRKIWLFNGA